jgi:hypothetical protein
VFRIEVRHREASFPVSVEKVMPEEVHPIVDHIRVLLRVISGIEKP